MFFGAMSLNVLKLSLDQALHVNRCADLDLPGADLRVAIALLANAVKLYLVVDRFAWRIVVEHVQRTLAGVETAIAKLRLVLGVGLALLELEAATGHVLVKPFVCFHMCHPFVLNVYACALSVVLFSFGLTCASATPSA